MNQQFLYYTSFLKLNVIFAVSLKALVTRGAKSFAASNAIWWPSQLVISPISPCPQCQRPSTSDTTSPAPSPNPRVTWSCGRGGGVADQLTSSTEPRATSTTHPPLSLLHCQFLSTVATLVGDVLLGLDNFLLFIWHTKRTIYETV